MKDGWIITLLKDLLQWCGVGLLSSAACCYEHWSTGAYSERSKGKSCLKLCI